jgi:hypothetical protein
MPMVKITHYLYKKVKEAGFVGWVGRLVQELSE